MLATGPIERDVTVNLVALHGIRGKDAEATGRIQKYLLALSLLAATADIDLFLREGCHLRYAGEDVWHQIPRRGDPTPVDLVSGKARALIQAYACTAVTHFKAHWKEGEHVFDLKEAEKLLAKKEEESPEEG